jgi:hypothetical protein
MKLRFIALVLPLIFAGSTTFAMPINQTGISFHQALDVIQKAGYQNIHKIELEHNYYEVEALDAKGKEIEFKIDATTGKISPVKICKHGKHKHHAKHKHVKHAAEATAPANQ